MSALRSQAFEATAHLAVDDDVRGAHRELGELSEKLLERVLSDPAWRRRSSFELLEREAWNPYPIQPWPLILGRRKLAELGDASLALVRLLRLIPGRVFRHDYARMAAFYRLPDPGLARMISEELDGLEGLSSRADFVESTSGLKALEVNLGSPGGLQLSRVASTHLRLPLLRRFLADERTEVGFTDSLRILLRHVVSECLEKLPPSGPELNVAILSNEEFPPQLARAYSGYVNRLYAESLAELAPGTRGQVVLGLHRFLRERRGGVFLGPVELQAIVELGNSNWHASFRAWKAGRIRLYNGPASMILADKRNLAFLSENERSPLLDAEEQAAVRRWIPWTRQVTPGYTDYRGERVLLRELIARERSSLVLKPGRSGQGKDVHLGAATPQAAWEEVLATALRSGDWVVQEYLDSRPFLAQTGEDGCAPHDVIWGVFTFGPHYGGGFLRLQPRGEKRIVNAAQGASEGVFLEVR